MRTLIHVNKHGKTIEKNKVSNKVFKRYLRNRLYLVQQVMNEIRTNVTNNNGSIEHSDIIMEVAERINTVRDINKRNWRKV